MNAGADISLLLAQSGIAATGLFFIALGLAAWLVPARAGRFLLAFASTPGMHFAELALRLLAGSAFILAAPASAFPRSFHLFGLLLIGTTAVMLLLPWRWHRRFTERAVPPALRLLPLIGLVSITAGCLALWAIFA